MHNQAQETKTRESIRESEFIDPILLDENVKIIAGHERVVAVRYINRYIEIPAIVLSHLTDAQKCAYRIAGNKLSELGKYDIEALNPEFAELSKLDLDFDLDITGFETAEIDLILDDDGSSDQKNDLVPAVTDDDLRCKCGDI